MVNQSTNQLRPFFPSTPPFLACLPNPAKVGTSVLLPALGLREENTSASHTPKAYVSRLHIHNYTLHSSYSHKSTIGRRSQADHGTLASFLRLRLTRGLSCFWIDTPPPRVLLFAHSRFSWCVHAPPSGSATRERPARAPSSCPIVRPHSDPQWQCNRLRCSFQNESIRRLYATFLFRVSLQHPFISSHLSSFRGNHQIFRALSRV